MGRDGLQSIHLLDQKRYGLRHGVTFVEQSEKPFLLSRFPVKVAALPPSLVPLLSYLQRKGDCSLEELWAVNSSVPRNRIESFLDALVKKGYLKEKGLSHVPQVPKVSIIVPVRNRPKDIQSCVSSLMDLSFPRERLEIIIVDDASEDLTSKVVDEFQVKRLRTIKREGASYCRNLGAEHAKGEILCFLDSDCVADTFWIREIVSTFRDPHVGACGGGVESQDDQAHLDRYEQVKSALRVGMTRKDSRNGDRFFYVPSCNMAVRREVFLRLGGFRRDLEVGEDVDLCWRIIDHGYVIEYRPAAKVFHRHRNRVLTFCRRRFVYGTSEPLLQSLHRRREKQFLIWPRALGFWLIAALALMTGLFSLVGCLGLLVLGDVLNRRRKARRLGISLPLPLVFLAVLRSYLSFLYQVCSFFSRYYLLLATLLLPILPVLCLGIWISHAGVGVVQFFVLKPRLHLPAFLFFFTLEQLSYQAGVWLGCLKAQFFSPVSPNIVLWRTY